MLLGTRTSDARGVHVMFGSVSFSSYQISGYRLPITHQCCSPHRLSLVCTVEVPAEARLRARHLVRDGLAAARLARPEEGTKNQRQCQLTLVLRTSRTATREARFLLPPAFLCCALARHNSCLCTTDRFPSPSNTSKQSPINGCALSLVPGTAKCKHMQLTADFFFQIEILLKLLDFKKCLYRKICTLRKYLPTSLKNKFTLSNRHHSRDKSRILSTSDQ